MADTPAWVLVAGPTVAASAALLGAFISGALSTRARREERQDLRAGAIVDKQIEALLALQEAVPRWYMAQERLYDWRLEAEMNGDPDEEIENYGPARSELMAAQTAVRVLADRLLDEATRLRCLELLYPPEGTYSDRFRWAIDAEHAALEVVGAHLRHLWSAQPGQPRQ